MKSFTLLLLICVAALLLPVCSRQDFRPALAGTWEWTGDACDKEGNCKKEIMTDEESREIFTKNGLYLSKRMRTGYIVEGVEIRLASDKNSYNKVYGEIISIKKSVMLLKTGATIRRYNRIAGT